MKLELSVDEHHNLTNGNGTVTSGHKPTSPYSKLLEAIKHDSRIQWELTIGKRIGLYTLKGELGCGNFSRVKAGIHALTKGK